MIVILPQLGYGGRRAVIQKGQRHIRFARKGVKQSIAAFYRRAGQEGQLPANHQFIAAMAAPSGMDIRPWHFVVLTDTSQYATIFEGNGNMKKFMESGAIIVVCADTTVTRPTRENPDGPAVTRPNPMWRDDIAAATENLLLAVEAHGLGACWTACYPFPETMAPVKKALGLPAEVVPYAVVPIGYPKGDTQPKDKWAPARIHYGRW